jgi:glycosyltransferase involved in cell wall biosynthesis
VNNTVILRGFPSIGYPDNLPDRELNSSDQTVITFAGRFDSLRGIFKFLDICDSGLMRDHDIEFWICGYGPEYQTVEEIVTDLPESVKFFGTLRGESYVQRIVSSDVLVNFQDPTMPDSNHVFPSKLLDFMSSGNIILSTPVGDVAEHLDHIINITESDSENIEQNLVEIVTNSQEYEHKAKKGPMWVKENCSYMHASKQLDKLIG